MTQLLLWSTRLLWFFWVGFFLFPQTGTFCRCEFLSDSSGDKLYEFVIAVPWVGVCLLWNIQMSLCQTPPSPPHLLFVCHPPLSLYSCHSVSHQLSKLPLFTFFNLLLSISHCCFLSLSFLLFSPIFSPSLILFVSLMFVQRWHRRQNQLPLNVNGVPRWWMHLCLHAFENTIYVYECQHFVSFTYCFMTCIWRRFWF